MTEVLEPAHRDHDTTDADTTDADTTYVGPEPGTASEPDSTLPSLGPDSLTYRYFGDWRGLLFGLWSGSMQNMHPKLAAGVWDHSDFFGERWERLLRSMYPIGGVVFDPDQTATGHEVRDYHPTIKGQMDDGGRYHSLDPDVFYWAHATFWYGNVRCA